MSFEGEPKSAPLLGSEDKRGITRTPQKLPQGRIFIPRCLALDWPGHLITGVIGEAHLTEYLVYSALNYWASLRVTTSQKANEAISSRTQQVC